MIPLAARYPSAWPAFLGEIFGDYLRACLDAAGYLSNGTGREG